MKKVNKDLVTGVFPDTESAEEAYNSLLSAGYRDNEIHLVMSEQTHKKQTTEKTGAAESTLISSIAAISTLVPVPGIGLIMTGPLAASLAEDGVEDLPEDLLPSLIGYGIPVSYANEYQTAIKAGSIMIGFHPHNKEDEERFALEWTDLRAQYLYRQALT